MARHTIRGNIRLYWFSTEPADPAAITAAELAAATDILGVTGGEAAYEMEGFGVTPSTIPAPDLVTNITGTIPGDVALGDASIGYYEDTSTNPIQDLLTDGLTGFLLACPRGAATGDPTEFSAATVSSNNRDFSSGNTAATYAVSFSRGVPVKGTLVA